MDSNGPESNQCPACKGSGKMVTGYGVVCTEIVEKIGKCPAWKGNGPQCRYDSSPKD